MKIANITEWIVPALVVGLSLTSFSTRFGKSKILAEARSTTGR